MLIRNVHQIIVQETDREWAGRYRNANVIIGGAKHSPPDALQVAQKMRNLISWLNSQKNKTDIIELSALLHHKLVHIHPFFDGNGRNARLAMNLLLMQAGYPLVVNLKNDRKKYYDVLDKADSGKYEPLSKFVAQAVERSLDIYLKTLTPRPQSRRNLCHWLKYQNFSFSAKYLNLPLARQGKLEAHKEGRDWLTTKEAIERYLKNRIRQKNLNNFMPESQPCPICGGSHPPDACPGVKEEIKVEKV